MRKLITILLSLFVVNAYAQKDTVKVIMLISAPVSVVYGWSVRELRNTGEKDSSTVLCCSNYWQHTEYLSELKKPLSGSKEAVIVWAATDSLWTRNELVKK